MPRYDEQLWDRMPDEGSAAYAAFCAYRDLGVGRSLERAYRATKGQDKGHVSGRWTLWAKAYNWRDRAEAYDVHMERQARREKEAAHLKALEEHRDRQRKLGIANIDAATNVLIKINERLKTLEPDEISVKHLPAFMRAAADMAEKGGNAEADSLGVDQVILSIENAVDEGG